MEAQPGSGSQGWLQSSFVPMSIPWPLCWGPAPHARAGEMQMLQGAAEMVKVGQGL